MSQEKVERYKEYKRNKDKILKREKMMHRIELSAAAIVCAGLLGWIGYSVYDNMATQAQENREQTVTEISADALDDYLNNLNSVG